MPKMEHPEICDVPLERVMHALSDTVRLGVVRQLADMGEATCAVLDGGRPKSTMSHHFRVLRQAGLVHTRTDGAAHMNTLRSDELETRFPGLLAAVLAARP